MGKILVRALGVLALTVTSLALASTVEATALTGVITGKVVECGPGPIVASPPSPRPHATPATVELIRNGRPVARKSVVFGASTPWVGSFAFRVHAGRYEVITSYRGSARWVNLRPGENVVVSFGAFACPMQLQSSTTSSAT